MHEPMENFQPAANALSGRTILITGAAGGLGSALAHATANLGADLILLDRNERGLNQLHDELEEKNNRQPGLYPLDLAGANANDYSELASIVTEEFGQLDGLVHCAATLGQITPIDNIDPQTWLNTFTVNLHGPFLLTQALLPSLRASDGSSIIFTLDNKNRAYWGAYGASKAATGSLMRIIADELSPAEATEAARVTCNAIDPGAMKTSLRASAFPGENPNSNTAPALRVNPYLYLLCDLAGEVNGQEITLQ